ncbi:MAG: glycosyltransferase [Bacteroidia bacterium]|nr:glycosyltransferase [Bacteroidia bacterium]
MEQNNPPKIVIITTQPFPIGLAGTNRILSYCKGFLYHGYQPEVICIRPTESYSGVFINQASGMYEGIIYSYPGRTTVRVKSFWGRRKNDLFSEFASIRSFYKILKKGKVSFIIFYGNCISVELASIIISRGFKIKIYKEESENPEIYFQGNSNFLLSLKKWFVINKLYKFYYGVLVMTHPLQAFFLTKGIPNKRILLVPQTVDHGRFEKRVANFTMSLPNDYIAFMGSLNQNKDGVLTLIESFREVSSKYTEMHLIIAGEGAQQEKNELSSLINALNLNDRVQCIGRISSIEIPAFLNGAKLLASCRPQSLQSDYGFPTKVVEYLASGTPVVTTAPGELVFYLKDRENAFVAEKAEPDTFAAKMLEALQDYDFAMKVAQNGKALVKDKFNPITQTKKIIDFCKE